MVNKLGPVSFDVTVLIVLFLSFFFYFLFVIAITMSLMSCKDILFLVYQGRHSLMVNNHGPLIFDVMEFVALFGKTL